MPLTPNLTVTDNGDGTGGVATIAGSSPGSVTTIYYLPWTANPGSMSLRFAGIVNGDGTFALGLPPAGYFFQAVSSVAGVPGLPTSLVYQPLTSASGIPISLLGAILAYFNASSLPALFPSGLWVEEIPEDRTFPFLVLYHNGETPDETTEDSYLEAGSIQFEVFQVGLAATEALALAVKLAFDPLCATPAANPALKIANAYTVKCERTGYKVGTVEGRDKNQNKVYQATIPYETEVRKTLGVS